MRKTSTIPSMKAIHLVSLDKAKKKKKIDVVLLSGISEKLGRSVRKFF